MRFFRPPIGLVWVIWLLILLLELATPPAVVLGILYVVPLLLGASQRTSAQAWRFLLISCLATLMNLLLPGPVDHNLVVVLTNRLLVCLALGVTTALVVRNQTLQRQRTALDVELAQAQLRGDVIATLAPAGLAATQPAGGCLLDRRARCRPGIPAGAAAAAVSTVWPTGPWDPWSRAGPLPLPPDHRGPWRPHPRQQHQRRRGQGRGAPAAACELASHLNQLAVMREVWVADDGEQGLGLLASRPVDLVLLDLVMPGLGGLATCRRITATTTLLVLILTSQEDPLWVQRIWDAGARGYLHKERALAQVELALASLLAGASWWDQRATAALQRSDPLEAIATSDQNERLNGLTQREREVLACLAAGDNNRAIARRLGIGEGTVRSHVHVLLQKLQVSNRTQAALIWLAGTQHN